jgi:hypothetical protein
MLLKRCSILVTTSEIRLEESDASSETRLEESDNVIVETASEVDSVNTPLFEDEEEAVVPEK